jgi:RimJ/RimL family protein N-acetyltransferase
MTVLETPRLILRPFQDADLEPFREYRSDPQVARYQGWETPFSRPQAEAFIREMKRARPGVPGTWYQFALQRKLAAGLIGDCGFHIFDHDPRQAEIGYTVASRFQRMGYGSEGVGRLLDFLFAELGLHRVTATCDVQNQASARLLERVGMRREGHYLENIWFKGAWGSEYLYALLEREWQLRGETPPEG